MFELNKILIEKDEIRNSHSSEKNINYIKKNKELGKFDHIDRNLVQELIDVIFKYKNLYEGALRYLNN